MTGDVWQTVSILVAGVATLAIFSFLVKENPIYRVFEHIYIGIAAGYSIMAGIKDQFYPQVIVPMFGLDIVQYPDGTWSGEYNSMNLLLLIPMAFGLLYYAIYSAKYSWLAKIAIGLGIGISGGLTFEGFFAEMMPQITSSFKPLVVVKDGVLDWGLSLNNIVFVVTLLSVMYYFFFSFRVKSHGPSKIVNSTGRFMMMICFGAFFGSTVMARMALLVERLQFLLTTWWDALKSLV